jgi:hypothetical protein
LTTGRNEKRVAQMYATSGAALVCVANYSPFGSIEFHNLVFTARVDGMRIFMVDEFRPDNVPTEVAEAIADLFPERKGVDVLVDVSKSMGAAVVSGVLDELALQGIELGRWFVWAGDCEEISGRAQLPETFSGGETDMRNALSCHASNGDARAIVVTDSDGGKQFTNLVQVGEFEKERYYCFDVAGAWVQSDFERWLASK